MNDASSTVSSHAAQNKGEMNLYDVARLYLSELRASLLTKPSFRLVVYHPPHYGRWLNLRYLISTFPTFSYNESTLLLDSFHQLDAKSMTRHWITERRWIFLKLGQWVYSVKNNSTKTNGPDQQNVVVWRSFPLLLIIYAVSFLALILWSIAVDNICFCIFMHCLKYD